MRILLFLLQKEFIQILRNKTILRMIFVLPCVQLLMLPWAATFEQKNIMLSVVDNDRSTVSMRLVEKITASGYFKLTNYSPTYFKALEAMEQDETDLILEIPRNFEKNFIREQQTEVLVSVNAVNGQKAGLGASYLGQILADYNQEMKQDPQLKPDLQIMPYFKYNKEMNYRNFMVPGILVMLLSMIGCMLSALNIVREKELGTIEQINVTPVPKYLFIVGKVIPFWIIGMFLLTLGMFIAWAVYELLPKSSVFIIYLFAFFYLLAFTGLGLIISNYSSTQQQAMFGAFFFLITFFLLSGLYTPISSMPIWAQKITLFNPVRYFIEVMRLVYMKGSSLQDILPQLKIIIVFAFVLNIGAIYSYKKTSG